MNISEQESHCLCTRATFAVPNPVTDQRGHSPFHRLEDKVTELTLGVCPGGLSEQGSALPGVFGT